MVKSPNSIAVILSFIVLLVGFWLVNSAPSYFTGMQKTLMYLVLLLVFGAVLAYSMK